MSSDPPFPPVHLRTATNYFSTRDSCSRQKGGGDNCTGKSAASLWRALHFSGCDELLCSHFNSQRHIIGHHLGLSFLFSSSIFLALSTRLFILPSPHALHVHPHRGNHASVVDPRHFPERLCNVITRNNWSPTSQSGVLAFSFERDWGTNMGRGRNRAKGQCGGGPQRPPGL